MVDLNHIHPVTEFNRNTKEHIRRLKKTGKPEVLTVNGHAEIVVQSAKGYQELLDAAEMADALIQIREGLNQAKRGEGRTIDELIEELARKRSGSSK